MADTHTNVLVRMTVEMKADLNRHAKANDNSLTAEITQRLKVSLAAAGPTLQAILAREAAANTPGIAPGSPPPSTGPDGQPVKLSDIDMALMRAFHALDIEKQIALVNFVTLFK